MDNKIKIHVFVNITQVYSLIHSIYTQWNVRNKFETIEVLSKFATGLASTFTILNYLPQGCAGLLLRRYILLKLNLPFRFLEDKMILFKSHFNYKNIKLQTNKVTTNYFLPLIKEIFCLRSEYNPSDYISYSII